MKNILLILLLCLINGYTIGQGLQSTIENKIWTLSESYVNNIRNYDTLFLKFESSGNLHSGLSLQEVSGSGPFVYGDTYSIQEIPGNNPYPILIVNDGEEIIFNVIYYDTDDLILINSGYLEDSETEYSLEYRFILYE